MPNYPPTTLATVEEHLACRDAIALSIAKWSKGEAAPDDVKIPIDLLITNQPRGSLSKARLLLEGPHAGDVAITIKDRNERSLEGAAFFVLSALALLDPSALHLNETSKDETKRLDYPKVFTQTGAGITAIRILADAQAGEMVMQRQTGDYHDLSASNLVVAPGNRLMRHAPNFLPIAGASATCLLCGTALRTGSLAVQFG